MQAKSFTLAVLCSIPVAIAARAALVADDEAIRDRSNYAWVGDRRCLCRDASLLDFAHDAGK
jgi:hypothetical protein